MSKLMAEAVDGRGLASLPGVPDQHCTGPIQLNIH